MTDISVEKSFHALSDPVRIQVLANLREREFCVRDLCELLDISQSKLSFHLKVLKDAEIVQSRTEGRWTYYSLNIPQFELMEQYLADFRRQTLLIHPPSTASNNGQEAVNGQTASS